MPHRLERDHPRHDTGPHHPDQPPVAQGLHDGYAVYAANEAEKAAHINLVDVKPFGNFGRLTMMGTEAEEAQRAAVRALETINRSANG